MSLIMLEFLCAEHGRFESVESRGAIPDALSCPICGELAPWTISAPKVKPQYGAVTQGKVAEAPPGALSTQALADGMPTGEFKQQRRAERRKRAVMRLPKSVRDKVRV